MATLQSKLEALESEHEKKKQNLIKDATIRDLLPTCCESVKTWIHFGKLYGTVGSIKLEPTRYSSIDGGKRNPTFDDLRELVGTFPPVPILLCKDSCSSFRPKQWQESLDPEKRKRMSEIPVAPFYLDVRPSRQGDNYIEFNWFAEIDGDLWRFEVCFNLHSQEARAFGDQRTSYKNHPGYVECIESKFTPNPASPEYKCVRFASGGMEYPNSHKVHFTDTDLKVGEYLDAIGG